MKRMKYLALIIALILAAGNELACKEDKPLQKFWDKAYIPLLVKLNTDKIVSLTIFPFYVYEVEEKKHIIDEPFFRSIAKVLFNKAFIEKFKKLKIDELPFDGTYYRIKFDSSEAPQNLTEIFAITGCFNYMFKPTEDGKRLIFSGIEINLPCN